MSEQLTEEDFEYIMENMTIAEYVELDELSKDTLKSYVKKAGRNATHHDDSAENLRGLESKFKNKENASMAGRNAKRHEMKSDSRVRGILKAAKKLSNGEYEAGGKITRHR